MRRPLTSRSRLRGAAGREGVRALADGDHRFQRRVERPHRLRLGGDVIGDAGAAGDEHAAARRRHDRRDLLGPEQRIDRIGGPGERSAPERVMGFRKVRQEDRHRRVGPRAVRVEQVGGGDHPRFQLGEGHGLRPVAGAAARQPDQRRIVGRPRRARAQHRIQGAERDARFDRHRLDGANVLRAGEAFHHIGLASIRTAAITQGSVPRLTQACLVARWTMQSPGRSGTSPSSITIAISPLMTTR